MFYLDLDECYSKNLACDCKFREQCPLYDKLLTVSDVEYERRLLSAKLAMTASGVNSSEVEAFTKQHVEKRKILLAQVRSNTSTAGSN